MDEPFGTAVQNAEIRELKKEVENWTNSTTGAEGTAINNFYGFNFLPNDFDLRRRGTTNGKS